VVVDRPWHKSKPLESSCCQCGKLRTGSQVFEMLQYAFSHLGHREITSYHHPACILHQNIIFLNGEYYNILFDMNCTCLSGLGLTYVLKTKSELLHEMAVNVINLVGQA
jgi:hypothetical protein